MLVKERQGLNFVEFLDWYPDDGKRYELIDGAVVEMLPTGSHGEVGGFIASELNFEIRRQNLNYFIPIQCHIKPNKERTGYLPDVAVIKRDCLQDEPLWESSSAIENGKTIALVVEVVSTNWRDDYYHKYAEYEALGIAEYWIVDYKGLGGVRHIGKPKQPTVTICNLVEGEYQMEKFVKGERLESQVFPQLELNLENIFR